MYTPSMPQLLYVYVYICIYVCVHMYTLCMYVHVCMYVCMHVLAANSLASSLCGLTVCLVGKHHPMGGFFRFKFRLSMYIRSYAMLHYIYCILRGRIKGYNRSITTIMCQQVVIELWLGSYSTVVGWL